MRALFPLILSVALLGCGGGNTGSNVATPGDKQSATTEALEVGADVLQSKAPLDALNAYLDGFHFESGDLQAQMEAHHYCGHLNEDSIQCVIFDGNTKNAKIIGVEYIISRRLFDTLPPEEQHLWHSHVHEVRSGTLIAPGIPDVAEHTLMQQLVDTYGKTWHTWHTDHGDALPLGTPRLMMGFTQDGQLNEQLVRDRDRRFEMSTADRRTRREDIKNLPIAPEADAWQKGIAPQIQLRP